jgi:quercetin dioxygenase-like cupin family protein
MSSSHLLPPGFAIQKMPLAFLTHRSCTLFTRLQKQVHKNGTKPAPLLSPLDNIGEETAMPQYHPRPGEPIDIRPLGGKLTDTAPIALVRTDDIEVMRLVLSQGKSIPQHQVAGEITLQCIEGTVEVQAQGKAQPLAAGELLYLHGNTPYALYALQDSSVLMTMLRKDSGGTL